MNDSLIKKTILHAGTQVVSITDGSKVRFHYCTRKCDQGRTIIDDSKTTNSPMELIIGKKFKLEIWETAIKTMALNEISSFVVDKSLVQSYPFVSKTLRDFQDPKKEKKGHCCAATLQNHGVGYEDLNMLIKEPCNLEFILELIQVESSYEKESWQMDENEKLNKIPELKNEGNKFYQNKEYQKAAEKYATAIGLLEQLMLKEKPKDVEWMQLNKIKVPILLNYAQCKLLESDYYSVIEHCTTVLESEPNNVKALFRRAKAHVGAWNFQEAKNDFLQVIEVDPKSENLARKELHELEKLRKAKDAEDKAKLFGKMF